MHYRGSGCRQDVNKFSQTTSILKRHDTGYFGEKRVVAADSYVLSRLDLGASLANNDRAAQYLLAAEGLHAQSLGLAVPPVSGASNSLFVCHTNLF
jgi:hypothetical protein